MLSKNTQPITPKSFNALQRLLQQNTPTDKNNKKANQSGQASLSQTGSLQYPFHKPKQTKKLKEILQHDRLPKKTFSQDQHNSQTSLTQSVKNDQYQQKSGDPLSKLISQKQPSFRQDMKTELLKVLNEAKGIQKKNKKNKKPQISKPVQICVLNQLLQTQPYIFTKQGSTQIEQHISSERNDQYKQHRPPELIDIGDDGSSQTKKMAPHSAQNRNTPQHFTFNQDILRKNQRNTGCFTTTNARLGPGGGGSGYTMFGSLNEVLRQYIQTKSSLEKCQEAGTGEGVKIGSQCQSARNQQSKPYFEASQERKFTPRLGKNMPLGETFDKLYLKAAKLLHGFKAKELQWKQEKKALKEEVQFLKQLLKQTQQEEEDLN